MADPHDDAEGDGDADADTVTDGEVDTHDEVLGDELGEPDADPEGETLDESLLEAEGERVASACAKSSAEEMRSKAAAAANDDAAGGAMGVGVWAMTLRQEGEGASWGWRLQPARGERIHEIATKQGRERISKCQKANSWRITSRLDLLPRRDRGATSL